MIKGVKVATEIALVVKELQPTGNLVTVIFTRLPDEGEFSVASLRGTYASNTLGYGGQMPEAGVGTFTFDGMGVSSTSFFQNTPGRTAFDRQISRKETSSALTRSSPMGSGKPCLLIQAAELAKAPYS